MMNLSSDNIRIFPTSNRTRGETGTNWVTEYNLASIINKLVDKTSFIISQKWKDRNEADAKDWLEFNIAGYYIKADMNDVVVAFSDADIHKNIYAYIRIATKADSAARSDESLDTSYYRLDGEDLATTATFVTFTSDSNEIEGLQADGYEYYSIHLLTRDAENNWVLVEDSKIMFDFNRIADTQTRIDQAETNSKSYTDEKLQSLDSDLAVAETDHKFLVGIKQKDGKIDEIYTRTPNIDDVDGLQDSLRSLEEDFTNKLNSLKEELEQADEDIRNQHLTDMTAIDAKFNTIIDEGVLE